MNLSSESETYFSNNTDVVQDEYYVIPPRITRIIQEVNYFGVVTFLAISGLILNIICCIMFFGLRKKSSTIIMLTALALTDILTLITGILQVFITCSEMYDKPFSKDVQIRMMPYVATYVTVIPRRIGNILTLLISLERLYAVIKPLKIRQYSTKRNAILAVVLSYMLPIVLCLPNLFYLKTETIYVNSTKSFITIMKPTEFRKQVVLTDSIYITTEILFRFIPVFGVLITSICIWFVIVVSARRRRSIAKISGQSTQEYQVTKTLLVIASVFVFCKLPVTILQMILFIESETSARPKNNVYQIVRYFAYDFMLANSVVNFFIYFNTSSTYNAEFKKLFKYRITERLSLPKINTISSSERYLDNDNSDINRISVVPPLTEY